MRRPARRLKIADLPTLGRPTMAMVGLGFTVEDGFPAGLTGLQDCCGINGIGREGEAGLADVRDSFIRGWHYSATSGDFCNSLI